MKTLPLALCALFAAAALPASAATWYNFEQSGHGLAVDTLSDESALLLWLSYDFAGNPMPLYAEARRTGAGAFTGTAYAPFGPRFNDFDPRELQFEPWGTLSFAPADCDDATLSWSSPRTDGGNAFGIGSTPLRPLTGGCTPTAAGELGGFEGTWHHPQLQGASINVDVVAPGSALLFWYTYDDAGQPMPVYIEASGQGGRLSGRAYAPRGMRFGSFARADLGVTQIGNVSLEFSDCRHAVFAYDITSGEGSFALSRLTVPQGVRCDLPATRPEWFGDRYGGRVESGTVGPGHEFVNLLVNSRDEVYAWISSAGIYRGSFLERNGAPWLQLRREGDYPDARFGALIEGPVRRRVDGRVAVGLSSAGRNAEAVLDAQAGPLPQGDLRTLLPGTYGEDECYGFVCFKRIEVHADLSYEVYEFGRVAFRGRLGNLDEARRIFDFDARLSWGPRVIGSGRLEYGEPLRPGGVRPTKLYLIGAGVGSGAFVLEGPDRAR